MNHCSEACGWTAGIVAAFSFGSFGVPIKSATKVDVDPLVMQSYKTIVCFLTCWFVLLMGEECRFTPWGILSGLFWVPGATAGIYGIRNAGLAVSVGIWSSLIVISSFCWGIFVFKERVKSFSGAATGAFILVFGLVGMSRYSAPVSTVRKVKSDTEITNTFQDEPNGIELIVAGGIVSKTEIAKRRITSIIEEDPITSSVEMNIPKGELIKSSSHTELVPLMDDEESETLDQSDVEFEIKIFSTKLVFKRRQLGILGAIINGTWGGTNMIPMHYARASGFGGAGYLISYSSGALLVTIGMWVLRYLFNVYKTNGDTKEAYRMLPSFYLREMWLAGFLSGSLYSLGNFCSIICVTVLGQGVGYSFIQTSMLISGLWGIFYFGEVTGSDRITKWLASSAITVIGILWLSYEHEGAPAH